MFHKYPHPTPTWACRPCFSSGSLPGVNFLFSPFSFLFPELKDCVASASRRFFYFASWFLFVCPPSIPYLNVPTLFFFLFKFCCYVFNFPGFRSASSCFYFIFYIFIVANFFLLPLPGKILIIESFKMLSLIWKASLHKNGNILNTIELPTYPQF